MKYYYINLDESIERRNNMENFFKNLSEYLDENIDYTRISGLNAKNIDNLDDYILL